MLATNGKTLYLDSGNLLEPGHKNCNGCHCGWPWPIPPPCRRPSAIEGLLSSHPA